MRFRRLLRKWMRRVARQREILRNAPSDSFLSSQRVRAAAVAIGAVAVVFALLTSVTALTLKVIITPSKVASKTEPSNINDLRPAECVSAGVLVSKVISGGVNITGTNSGDLILGEAATQTIAAGAADDCVVGGGATEIDGGGGANNVCIGLVAATMTNCAIEVRTP